MTPKPAPTPSNDGLNWKRQQDSQKQREARLTAEPKRQLLPASLRTLKEGQRVYYTPPKATQAHAQQRATVLRAPRLDVQQPTVRVAFGDGTQRTVPLRHLRLDGVRPQTPPWLGDARARPAWKRLVNLIRQGETDAVTLHRAQQLAGMVLPKGSALAEAWKGTDAARVLLEAATSEAQSRVAGRAGRGQPRPQHLPVPTDDLANLRLDQDQRAMVNNIARCIHRRYFLSDKELRDLSDAEREQAKIHGTLSTFIRKAQSEAGLVTVKDSSSGRGSALHSQLHDSLAQAYPLALEACQMLVAGKGEHAVTLALQVREHLLAHIAANTELDRARRKHHTGRYFHGDVLSVREEHEGGGMTQYYARLTIVYGEDGHSLIVANAAELESLTGTRVGAQAWTSLCQWIEDMSDRAGGKKPGRRQDDDTHLIYRDHDDHLELRESIRKYPNVLRAFECLRRALLMDEREKDVLRSEIPEHHPLPGFHAPQDSNQEES